MKKVVKAIMPTYTAQMQTDWRYPAYSRGFTMIEAMVVLSIASLLLVLGAWNLALPLRRAGFQGQAKRFAAHMQQAATSANQNGKRCEVIVDLIEQRYTLREISSGNLSDVLEEEIIIDEYFDEKCYISYVEFDDPDEDIVAADTDTETLVAKFRVGVAGWQYGGKIVLLDRDDNAYSVIVSTLSSVVTLENGDIEILKSKRNNELPF